MLIWESTENKLAKPPFPRSWCLVKGFVIEKGSRVRELRLAWFNGSEMEKCEDMIIESYAQLKF